VANSHKRETARRIKPKAAFIAGPLAVLATGAVVAFGVIGHGGTDTVVAVDGGAANIGSAVRPQTISRSEQRPPLEPKLSPADRAMQRSAVAKAIHDAREKQWTTTALNLWTRPDRKAAEVGEVKTSTHVLVTGRALDGRQEIVVEGRSRWVTKGYLSAKKPATNPADMALDFKPCGDMSVTNGLVPDMVRAYEAVCNAFPGQVSTYYGLGDRPEHSTGHAVDAMVYGNTDLGYKIAQFVQAHAAELNIYDIIYRQHIWTPVRASEGWRLMPDRGSPTANHMDHVHFGVN